jgi:glycosyltransferase involved in cell wall biosynthesis
MRVGILIPRLGGGGAEFVALQWAAYLKTQGHTVDIITTHGGPEHHSQHEVVGLAARTLPSRIRELRRHIAAADYDVLLALMPHWNVLALLSTLGRRGRPAVIISGRNIESALRTSQGLTYRLELLLARFLYRRADAYIAISHPVAAEAASAYGIDSSRIWVVPNPATGKFSGDRPQLYRSHGAAGEPQTVTLTVPARIVRQKQPELAVETAAVVRAQFGIAASVEYFGQGPDEARVREAASRLGVPVSFHGWVELWFDQAASDAVVLLTSSAEGFGNVLVEATAAGIPSVSSSRALGVADAIVPNVTGILCMGSAAADYAAAVAEAMQLTPVRAAAWLERFSPAESGRKLEQVLRASTRANESSSPSPRGRASPGRLDFAGRKPVIFQEGM